MRSMGACQLLPTARSVLCSAEGGHSTDMSVLLQAQESDDSLDRSDSFESAVSEPEAAADRWVYVEGRPGAQQEGVPAHTLQLTPEAQLGIQLHSLHPSLGFRGDKQLHLTLPVYGRSIRTWGELDVGWGVLGGEVYSHQHSSSTCNNRSKVRLVGASDMCAKCHLRWHTPQCSVTHMSLA